MTDVDQIIQPLVDKLSDEMDPDNAATFVRDVMQQVWNARGAADRAVLLENPDAASAMEIMETLDR